jgi:hypothetical protein
MVLFIYLFFICVKRYYLRINHVLNDTTLSINHKRIKTIIEHLKVTTEHIFFITIREFLISCWETKFYHKTSKDGRRTPLFLSHCAHFHRTNLDRRTLTTSRCCFDEERWQTSLSGLLIYGLNRGWSCTLFLSSTLFVSKSIVSSGLTIPSVPNSNSIISALYIIKILIIRFS